MNKEDIRLDDVVRLAPVRVAGFDIGYNIQVELSGRLLTVPAHSIEEIITRAETKDEIIARLEARVKELEAESREKTVLKVGQTYAIEPETEKPWYPPQQEGFGPWIEGPPPPGLDTTFAVLDSYERKEKIYDHTDCDFPSAHQGAEAHCIKLED